MYIGYLNDQKELGFSCIKDSNAIKQLSNLKSTLKNPVTWIITKGKQTVILIFSKEVLVAVFIFSKSSYIEPNVNPPSFTSSEVYQSCFIKSYNLRFKNYPLSKPNLVIRENSTLNKQEPTINIGDPESLGIVVFENNPLYEDHHFISGYPISEKAFETFEETGNIGSSLEKKAQEINKLQRTQAQAEREREAARSFYSSLPEEARIGNQQLREVEAIQERLREDPKSPLTEKEKIMIKRAEKYQQYKTQYYQNNPDIDRDEF